MTQFTVYSKPACPYCEQAKALLASLGRPFDVVHVDVGQPRVEGETYVAREAFLARWPTQRTLPLVLEGERVIGGFTELRRHLATG